MDSMDARPSCRVCESPYTLFVQNVVSHRRPGLSFPQFFCMDCRSFFHTSGYCDPAHAQIDFDELSRWRDNHMAIQGRLCHELIVRLPGIQSVCDIGHGLGWFMKACRDFGLKPYGFELNPHCHEHASKVLGLECCLGRFDASHNASYDLIAAIMVFEHLEEPRDLFREMVRHLNRDGAIYISVPFAHRRDWRNLWQLDQSPAQTTANVFFDTDAHITQFTVDGMSRMGVSLGARSAESFVSLDTYANSPGSYEGVLFRF